MYLKKFTKDRKSPSATEANESQKSAARNRSKKKTSRISSSLERAGMLPAVSGILPRTVSAYLRRNLRIRASRLREGCPATCRTERATCPRSPRLRCGGFLRHFHRAFELRFLRLETEVIGVEFVDFSHVIARERRRL